MSSNDYLRQTLTYYREQRQKILEQQLRPLDLMIRRIEVDLGEAPEEPGTLDLPPLPLSTLTPEHNGDHKPAGNGKRPEVRPGEFYSLSQGEAARAYLVKVGEPVSTEELVEVLNKGGCPVGGVDPKKTLYTVLIRNTKDFCKIPPDGYIGLRSMYPNLRSGAPKATPAKKGKSKKGKAGVKARTKATKTAKAKATAKSAAKKAPAASGNGASAPPPAETQRARPKIPLKATICEVLAGGELQSGDSILQRVQEKLGPTVQKYTVFSILKNGKEFEQVGDQYKLVV